MRWMAFASLVVAAAVSACSSSTVGGCAESLMTQAVPADTTIQVGQQFTAGIRLSTCGPEALQGYHAVTWASRDTTVVRIDAQTGRVTAVGAGRTMLQATSAQYGPLGGSYITVR